MATQAIGYSAYGMTNPLINNSSNSETKQADQAQSSKSESSSWKNQIRDQVNELLADIPKGEDGKLSFKDVDDHREKMEKEWDETVKADLKKLGVNVDVELPFTYSQTTGKLTVASSHPDSEKINQYFESNQDKVDDFKRIIQLGRMTQVSESKLNPAQIRQSIQQSSMAVWYEDNSDPTSWFKGGGLLLNQQVPGLAYSGLNLKV